MLYRVCREIRNYFTKDTDKINGNFTISNSVISPDIGIKNGQYIRIIGSIFNDGIIKYGVDELEEETFEGCVFLMRIPKEFLSLVKDIEEFESKSNSTSAYTSETFGDYSYSKASTQDGTGYDWKSQYAKQLNIWRKI